MIQLRAVERLKIGFTIQVDTLCHRIPNFIEKDLVTDPWGFESSMARQ